MDADRHKKMIADALIDLSRKKSIDKVTVKDVVDACHISRQTFYYHFQDLTEVMEWSVKQITQQVLEESLKAETAEEALRILITAVAEQTRGMIPQLMDSQRRAKLELMMLQAARVYLQEMVRRRMPDLQISYADLQVAIDFYTYGITGLLLEYGINGNIQVEQLASQIYRLLEGSILRLTDEGKL